VLPILHCPPPLPRKETILGLPGRESVTIEAFPVAVTIKGIGSVLVEKSMQPLPSLLSAKPVRFACCAVLLGMWGGAGLWDELPSRNRDMKGYFFPPEPMVVLKKSSDGSKRAAALAALKEPHGSKEQEEEYYNILTRAALADNDPLCR